MAASSLRMEFDGATGKDCRGIWLDDQEISKFTTGIDIKTRAGQPHEVTIHVFVDHIDLGLSADVQINAPVLRKEVVE